MGFVSFGAFIVSLVTGSSSFLITLPCLLCNFLDEKERKRCPGYTAESMAAEDTAEAAAAHGESRDVDRDH